MDRISQLYVQFTSDYMSVLYVHNTHRKLSKKMAVICCSSCDYGCHSLLVYLDWFLFEFLGVKKFIFYYKENIHRRIYIYSKMQKKNVEL